MIKLLHPANINGKTWPAGSLVPGVDAVVEQRFIDAGNARRVTNNDVSTAVEVTETVAAKPTAVKKADAKKTAAKKASTTSGRRSSKSKPVDAEKPKVAETAGNTDDSNKTAEASTQPAQFGRSGKVE